MGCLHKVRTAYFKYSSRRKDPSKCSSRTLYWEREWMASAQICITLRGTNLHCTYTTESKGPFVRQPPANYTSPSPHIPYPHSQSHPHQPVLPTNRFSKYGKDIWLCSKVTFNCWTNTWSCNQWLLFIIDFSVDWLIIIKKINNTHNKFPKPKMTSLIYLTYRPKSELEHYYYF